MTQPGDCKMVDNMSIIKAVFPKVTFIDRLQMPPVGAAMTRFVHTVVIDESDLFREGLMRILSGTRFRVMADYPSLNGLALGIVPEDEESLMLIGVYGDSSSLLADLPPIKARHARLRVVMLSDQFDPEQLLAAVESGTDGYLLKKHLSPDALLKAMDLVFLGGSILPQRFMQLVRFRLRPSVETPLICDDMVSHIHALPPTGRSECVELGDLPRLSETERAILWHLTQGASNKLIARELRIAEATAKVHVKAILRKIRATNRTQAAMWAVNNMGQAVRHE
jgi:two-component system, NarL family, nitrate/nitrite response regulator NarL